MNDKPKRGVRPAHPDASLIRALLESAGGTDPHRRMRQVVRELRLIGRNDLADRLLEGYEKQG